MNLKFKEKSKLILRNTSSIIEGCVNLYTMIKIKETAKRIKYNLISIYYSSIGRFVSSVGVAYF